MISKLRKLPVRSVQYLAYLFVIKLKFGVKNTKRDISFVVFRESYLADQYRIKRFASHLQNEDDLLFLDLGRNHGFVFLFFVDALKKIGTAVRNITYVGIDPSPLKFVYHPAPPAGTTISHRLMDRAIVFDGSKSIHLKYGEDNYGNFNVTGSNYEKQAAKRTGRCEFIEIEVDTIQLDEVVAMLTTAKERTAIVVKIDCKNRTEVIMEHALDELRDYSGKYLVACESDGSADGRLQGRATHFGSTWVASNIDVFS